MGPKCHAKPWPTIDRNDGHAGVEDTFADIEPRVFVIALKRSLRFCVTVWTHFKLL